MKLRKRVTSKELKMQGFLVVESKEREYKVVKSSELALGSVKQDGINDVKFKVQIFRDANVLKAVRNVFDSFGRNDRIDALVEIYRKNGSGLKKTRDMIWSGRTLKAVPVGFAFDDRPFLTTEQYADIEHVLISCAGL